MLRALHDKAERFLPKSAGMRCSCNKLRSVVYSSVKECRCCGTYRGRFPACWRFTPQFATLLQSYGFRAADRTLKSGPERCRDLAAQLDSQPSPSIWGIKQITPRSGGPVFNNCSLAAVRRLSAFIAQSCYNQSSRFHLSSFIRDV